METIKAFPFRPYGLVALAFAVITVAPAAMAQTDKVRIGAGLEVLYDSNVNRAAPPDSERSDTILAADLNAVRSFLTSYRSGIIARGGLRFAGHTEYSDLSYAAAAGRVLYRYQHNPGFTGTILEVAGNLEFRQHSDSSIRNGWIGDVSVSAGKHLTDRLRLGAGVGYEGRDAGNAVYDTSAARVWGSADWRLTPWTTLYGNISFIDGDQVFNSAYGGTRANLTQYGRASAPDPALRKAFGGVVPYAYRVDAETWAYDLGLNYNLGNARALDFSVGYFDSEAKRGMATYDGFAARINYLHRFR